MEIQYKNKVSWLKYPLSDRVHFCLIGADWVVVAMKGETWDGGHLPVMVFTLSRSAKHQQTNSLLSLSLKFGFSYIHRWDICMSSETAQAGVIQIWIEEWNQLNLFIIQIYINVA